MEQLMNCIRKCLKPNQIGQFLVWLETMKNKQSLNVFDLWDIKKLGRKNEKDLDCEGLVESDEEKKGEDNGMSEMKKNGLDYLKTMKQEIDQIKIPGQTGDDEELE